MPLEIFDQPGIDQKPVEPARLCAARAAEEGALAAFEDRFLLCEGSVERKPRGFLHNERQVGRFEPLEGGRDIDRIKVDRVYGVVGCEIGRLISPDLATDLLVAERGIDQTRGYC